MLRGCDGYLKEGMAVSYIAVINRDIHVRRHDRPSRTARVAEVMLCADLNNTEGCPVIRAPAWWGMPSTTNTLHRTLVFVSIPINAGGGRQTLPRRPA